MTFMKLRKVVYNLFFWALSVYSLWLILGKFAPDFTQIKIIWAGPIAGAVALLFASLKINDIMSNEKGNDKMQELQCAVSKGVLSFFKKQACLVLLFAAVALFVILKFLTVKIAICFATGVIMALVAELAGLLISAKSASKTAQAAFISKENAFKTAFSSGLAVGLVTVALVMISIPVLYYLFQDDSIVSGFVFGASVTALFMRLGGGIFEKSSNLAINMVSKLQDNLSVNDSKNPVFAAEKAGKCAGDAVGLAIDIFESYAGVILASMALGAIILNLIGVFMPLTLFAMGVFISIIASCVVELMAKMNKNLNPETLMYTGTTVAVLLFAAIAYYLVEWIFLEGYHGILFSILTGVVAGCLICLVNMYLSSPKFKPVKKIAESAETNAVAMALLSSKSGIASTFFSIFAITVTALISYFVVGGMDSYNGGVYGISLGAVGMLSTICMIITINGSKAVCSNAKGLLKAADPVENAVNVLDEIDFDENSASVISKGIATPISVLAALLLFIAFAVATNLENIDILNPFVFCFILLGACVPFLYCALSMCVSQKTAYKMVESAKAQLNSVNPDYGECVKISTNWAALGTIIPSIVTLLTPLAVGFVVYQLVDKSTAAYSLGGMLIGLIVAAMGLAMVLTNSNSANKSAKELIEKENASVCCAKTSIGSAALGLSLNTVIKITAVIILICANFFMP